MQRESDQGLLATEGAYSALGEDSSYAYNDQQSDLKYNDMGHVVNAEGTEAPPDLTDPAPKDEANVVYMMLFIVGIATFFCSTAIMASNDYYESVWGGKGKTLVFFAPLLIQLTTPFLQTLLVKYQQRLTFTSRIEFGFLCNTAIAIIFPLQVTLLPQGLSFVVACVCILGVGMNNSILKVTEYSLVSQYPSFYTQSLLVGQGCSPLVAIILKMFLKGFYTPHGEDVKPDEIKAAASFIALVFFVISATMTTIAAIIFKLARRSTFSRYYFPSFKIRYQAYIDAREKYAAYKKALAERQANGGDVEAGAETPDFGSQPSPIVVPQYEQDVTDTAVNTLLGTEQDNMDLDTGRGKEKLSKVDHFEQQLAEMPTKVRKLEVFAKVKYYMFLIVLSTIPPCAVYPSLINVMDPNWHGILKLDSVWNHLWLMLFWCLLDVVGRAIPLDLISKAIPISKIEYWIGARWLIHATLVVLTYAGASSILHCILLAVIAVTQSMCLLRLLTSYKVVCNLTPEEANVSGSLAAIAVATGVLLGYALAFGTDAVYHLIW